MQKLIILILYLFSLSSVNAQLIPFGLDVTPAGKIVFSKFPPNYNGNLDDTTYVLCEDEQIMWLRDRRNVNYDFLTILEAPKENYATNLDPSQLYDTTGFVPFEVDGILVTRDYFFNVFLVEDSMALLKYDPDKFYDEFQGTGVTDSIQQASKKKVSEYAHQYLGKIIPEEIENQLKDELSEIDTVIDGTYVYDYLVDRFICYTYRGNQLVSALAYEYTGAVEFDSLTYDFEGNLIRFSREQIGMLKDEYCFDYSSAGKLVEISHASDYFGYPEEERGPDVVRYEYDFRGEINRRSELLIDGSIKSCVFQKDPFEDTEK